MQSIIEELWYGNICPHENGMPRTAEIQKLTAKIAELYDDLREALSKEQKELLDKLLNENNEYDCLSEAAIFTYGFRLGAKLILDALR